VAHLNGSRSSPPEKPVGWLIGLDLLRKLKAIAIYAAFGDRLDHKDWMTGTLGWVGTDDQPADREADWSLPLAPGASEFWFDYIADSGDGQTAMHNVACLCLSDLHLASNEAATLVKPTTPLPAGATHLPRGTFLMIGGDTAYHVADAPTLAERVQRPFAWAQEDLVARGWPEPDERPVVAIPGNHDYYDALHGFNQQFRRELPKIAGSREGKGVNPPTPRLRLAGFRRVQDASYFAVRLPFGWWLWGLDTQDGHLDIRQQQFFRGTCQGEPPDRLIVATPEPVVGLGAPQSEDSELCKTFAKLHLPRTFLGLGRPDGPPPGQDLGQGHVRLDLSGDLHHYERYGLSDGKRSDYAAVVAGTGGAFMHPTHPRFGAATPLKQDPPEDQSRVLIAGRILNPLEIRQGGYVHWAGMLIAATLLIGAAADQSFRSFAAWAVPGLGIDGLAPREGIFLALAGALAPPGTLEVAPAGPAGAAAAVLALLTVAGFMRFGLAGARRPAPERFTVTMWAGTTVSLLAVVIVALIAHRASPGVRIDASPPYLSFLNSVVVLLSITTPIAVLVWLGEFRIVFAGVRQRHVVADHGPPLSWKPAYALSLSISVMAIECFSAGQLRFARLPGAILFADAVVLIVVALCLVGLPLLAWFANGRTRALRRLPIAALGLAHGIGHLTLTILAVAFAPLWCSPVWLLAYFMVWASGRAAARSKRAAFVSLPLWLAWLALPMVVTFVSPVVRPLDGYLFAAVCIVALPVSCAILGSYLWCASLIGGHFNESGGAARLELHRQILRCCVSRDQLDVFVLGIDQPIIPRGHGDPPTGTVRLVEHFTLKPRM